MKKLKEEVVQFLQNQGYVIVSTIDSKGFPHSVCKGIVSINRKGKAYLLDLYKAKTFQNLKRNPRISITTVDEHKFKGYCLKGKARLIPQEDLNPRIIAAWENKITSRITQRVIKNMHEGKGHPWHPEAIFPKPAYMIVMEIEEIIDLTPHQLK